MVLNYLNKKDIVFESICAVFLMLTRAIIIVPIEIQYIQNTNMLQPPLSPLQTSLLPFAHSCEIESILNKYKQLTESK